MRSAAVAGVPASGVGPGDLKSNSGVFERAIDGVRWIDPVFYPDTGTTHPAMSPEHPVRFSPACH